MSKRLITLRKLSTVVLELKTAINRLQSEASQTATVTVSAISINTPQVVFDSAKDDRIAVMEQLLTLNRVFSRARTIIGDANISLGINKVLQEIREKEDLLKILTPFSVQTEGDVYSRETLFKTLEEAELHLNRFNEASQQVPSPLGIRSVGLSKAVVALPPVAEETQVKTLAREIKKLKEEKLLALNLTEVSFEVTDKELELLENLNIL